jgi:hypothetical protein
MLLFVSVEEEHMLDLDRLDLIDFSNFKTNIHKKGRVFLFFYMKIMGENIFENFMRGRQILKRHFQF